MAVRLNEDQEMVRTIREGLKRTGGYCPCRLESDQFMAQGQNAFCVNMGD